MSLLHDKQVKIEDDNEVVKLYDELCINCGKCTKVCHDDLSVHGYYDLTKTNNKGVCINCGQCIKACPTKALNDKPKWLELNNIIQKKKKKVIFVTAPATRVSLGEEFGYEAGTDVEGKLVSALRKLGASYVFDVTYGADLTIMEEATELVERIKENKLLPQFTSCCPSWVKFCEIYYPELIPNLSTSKSPISIMDVAIKTWFAKREGIKPSDIYICAITPCTAKKIEIKRSQLKDARKYNNDKKGYYDTDCVVTVRELANWLRAANIDIRNLENSEYDTLMPRGSGAGIIFGNTGGVMEAALRTAYNILTGKNPEGKLLQFEEVRGLEGIKKASVDINGTVVNVAVASKTANARQLIAQIKNKTLDVHFVEVMACPGGCIGGGGQPITNKKDVNEKRIAGLYKKDDNSKIRNSYENKEIQLLYKEFFGKPGSHLSHELLHTTYKPNKVLGEDPSKYNVEVINTEQQ